MAYDWIQRVPTNFPHGRMLNVLCWDGVHVLMYGGRQNDPSALLDDTWIWDGADWTELSPANDPGVLEYAGNAYDIGNGEVVLFGGNSNVPSSTGALSNETWTWNGTNWTQLSPANSPSARGDPRMAYDEVRGEVVLFSGYDGGGVMIDETWTWDGTDWTQKFPANSPFDPGVANQANAGLAWDPTNLVVVHHPTSLVGGFNDTWTWDGTNWTSVDSIDYPSGVELPGFANWRVGGKPFSFGGRTAGLPDTPTAQTRVWNGTDWTFETPVHAPGPRADISLAYDETRQEVVLFGGLLAGFNSLGDTWVWADEGRYTLHLET